MLSLIETPPQQHSLGPCYTSILSGNADPGMLTLVQNRRRETPFVDWRQNSPVLFLSFASFFGFVLFDFLGKVDAIRFRLGRC